LTLCLEQRREDKRMMIEIEDDIVLEDQAEGKDEVWLTLCLEQRREDKRMMIEIKDLDIPDNIQDSRPKFNQLIHNLLKKLPSVAKPSLWQRMNSTQIVKLDTKKQSEKNSLRLKVLVNKLTKKGKVGTEKWVEIFLRDFRISVFQDGNKMKSKLGEEGMSQEDIFSLMTPLTERDKISLNIEENDKKVLTAENLPLIPCFSRKLKDVKDEVCKGIINLFQDTFDELTIDSVDKTKMVMKIAFKLNKFDVDELDHLQNNIINKAMPYLTVLNEYIKHDGTFAGLTNCLDSCLKDKWILNNLGEGAEQKLNDMFSHLSDVTWREYETWVADFIPKHEKDHLAQFEAFTQKLESGWSPKDILEGNTKKWDILKEDVEEGDQIWMWRNRIRGLQYAHVGVYVGDGHMVHVSGSGLTAVIKKDPVKDVVGDSECYVVKSTPNEEMKGSIKERAEACIGIEFAYSVSSGNCESFVNCITNGIFTTDNSSAQGKEYPTIETIIKSINILRRAMTFKNQDQDLLNKIAENLYKHGLQDEDFVAQVRGLKI